MIPLPSVAGIVSDDENYRQLIYEALNRTSILGASENDVAAAIAKLLAGDVGIGTTKPDAPLTLNRNTGRLWPFAYNGAGPLLHLVAKDGVPTIGLLDGFGNGNVLVFRQANGSAANPTPSDTTAVIGQILGFGRGTTDWPSAPRVYINLSPNETWTDSAQGTRVAIATTKNGTTSTYVRVRIMDDGTLRLIGETSGYTGLKPAAAAGSATFTLPTVDGNAGDALVTDGAGLLAFSRILPAGVYIPYGGTTAPAGGWLMCDGATYSEAAYPALFAAIGHNFGGDPGGGNFRVPDMRQRFPLGKAASGTGSTLGGTGGSIDHTHSLSAHTHNVDIAEFNSGFEDATMSNLQSGGTVEVASTSHRHAVNPPTTATGPPGDDFTNAANPPWLAGNFIIKT